MKNKKILITGANGFVGLKLVKALKKNKIKYIKVETKKINKKNICKHKNITHFIHLGFRIKNLNNNNLKRNFRDIVTIIKSINQNTKLIFISSIGVDCFKNSKKIYLNNYLLSKLNCEREIVKKIKNYLILRFPNIYGPGENSFYLIPSIIKKLKKNRQVEIFDYADLRDYIHIDDVVKILLLSLNIEKTKIINIFSNNIRSVYSVLKLIIQKLKLNNIKIIKKNRHSIFPKGYYFKKKKNNFIDIKKYISFDSGISYVKK